jgi:hypothetical protein
MAATLDTGGGSGLKEKTIESAHPYENNMNHNEVICIPGATSLRLVFDSESLTESECDVLRFFSGPDGTGQLYEHSGSGFPDLEVPGDTVHLRFTTDGSCVEWGYRFTVYPVGGAAKRADDPLATRANLKVAMWIIDFILSYETIPASLTLFSSKYVINPL